MAFVYQALNWLCQPAVFWTVLTAAFFGALACRKFLVRRAVAGSILAGALVVMALSTFNGHFLKEAAKPDYLPLWAMLFLTGLCLWAAFYQAVRNDERLKQGLPPEEAGAAQKSLPVWPYLLYLEAIVAAFAMALLLAWALGYDAPLEQAANPASSPNPAKAPWYFVGLQELLVYFDPWIGGVLLPVLAFTGLICLPYCDPEPRGAGYFSFERRKFSITAYLFGFLLLWVAMICVGAFLRGPNWTFFGLYEPWDTDKSVQANPINFSQFFWRDAIGWLTGRPRAPETLHWFKRELPGFCAAGAYFLVLPLVGAKVFGKLYAQLGKWRYGIVACHLLVLLAVPIKIFLRLAFNLKYIIFVPEYFFDV
jgi:hypothetical protein